MKRFLIPSLFAAGFGSHDTAVATAPGAMPFGNDGSGKMSLFEVFKQDHAVTLAQHRSHRSHSSHSSHRSGSGGHSSHYSHTSHRSSTGGSYTAPSSSPAHAVPAPPPPAPAPSTPRRLVPLRTAQPGEATPPRTDALPALSGRTARFAAIVKRVQIGLLAQGYYSGPIDGVVGTGMRAGLRQFQKSRGIAVTGTITPEVLDALRIASE